MTLASILRCELSERPALFWSGLLLVYLSGLLAGLLPGWFQLQGSAFESTHQARLAALNQEFQSLETDLSRSMRQLGFHAALAPKGQQVADWYADDYSCASFTEEDLAKLIPWAAERFSAVVPESRQRIDWPERKWTVIVVGLGQPVGMDLQDITLPRPAKGEVVVGSELASALNLLPDTNLTLFNQTFHITRIRPSAGTADDVSLWLNWQEAQSLPHAPASRLLVMDTRPDTQKLLNLRKALATAFPGVELVEQKSEFSAAAEALKQSRMQREATLNAEHESNANIASARLRTARTSSQGGLVAALLLMLWLAHAHVKERRAESGLWLALGMNPWRVTLIISGRFLILSLAGCCLSALTCLLALHHGSQALNATMQAVGATLVMGFASCAAIIFPVLRQDPAFLLSGGRAP